MSDTGDLPDGWSLRALGDVTAPSSVKVDPTLMPEARYIGLEHIEAQTRRIVGNGLGADVKSEKAAFRAGQVLYGKLRPYLNKVAIPDFDGIASTDILVFEESKHVTSEYLARLMNSPSFVELAHHSSAGMELPRTSWKALSRITVPLPPVPEQRRIVRNLTEIEDHSAAALHHLQSVRKIVQDFEQAIVAAACSGQLTADWREFTNPQPASEKLEKRRSYLRESLGKKYRAPDLPDLETLPDIPPEWCWAALPELGELGRGKSKHRPRNDPKLYGGNYPFVQTGDVSRSGGRVSQHSQTYNEAGLAQSRLWPAKTVCITIAANIANSALLTYPACFPDSVVGLIAAEGIVLPEYVELFIRTARKDLAAFAPATAQANINLNILSQVAVALPPIEEQREIIKRVDDAFRRAADVDKQADGAATLVGRSHNLIVAQAIHEGGIADGSDGNG